MKKTLYAPLGLQPDASLSEIQDAQQRLLATLRPDEHIRRLAINEAASVLSHPQRRAVYDASLHAAAAATTAAQSDLNRGRPAEPRSRKGLALMGVLLALGGLLIWYARKPAPPRPKAAPAVARAVTLPALPTITPTAPQTVRRTLSPEELFAQASQSVVRINVSDGFGNGLALGSGVVIDRGVVITNCHVALAGPRLDIRYLDQQYSASILTADERHDLCKLSVLGLSAPNVTMDKVASLKVGQKVYAIGSPQGLDLTLSDGMISSLRQEPIGTLIQTSAPVSPGSSGGGLFTEQGTLAGIITFQMRSGQNLNFALPTDWILTMSDSTAR